MEAKLYDLACSINTYLSNYILIFLLIGVGLWYSVKTRFVQVRCFGEGMRRVFANIRLRGDKQQSGMSSFQALATAVAAQVGTGNIVGASGAILTGGPGAIFWMWIIAFLGMATIYSEAVLAIETRQKDEDGNIKGGPVYYITTAFKGKFGKFLAGFFAVATVLALGFMGCMVQSNSIGSTMENAFGIPSWVVGIILVIICGIIFIGGVQRLASVTEKLVPVMAVIFLLGGLAVLVARIKYIPATFGMIFKYAFQPQAILGGAFGAGIKAAISQGAKRGLFSNEAGMGSTPHAHAQANVACPHDQGVVAMIGVFIDTFVVLTLNALVIISTLYTKDGILYTVGVNSYGQLGRNGTTNDNRLAKIDKNIKVKDVAVGNDHLVIVDTNNVMYGVGHNNYKQLGTGCGEYTTSFVKVATGVTAVSAGRRCTTLIRTDGHLYGLGDNRWEKLVDGAPDILTEPTLMMKNVAFCASGQHQCAFVTETGTLYYAGWRPWSSFQQGSGNDPTAVKVMDGVDQAYLFIDDMVILCKNGDAYVYGLNTQNSIGGAVTGGTPKRVAQDVVSVAVGYGFSAYLYKDGTICVQGDNAYGQAGNGLRGGSVTMSEVFR